MFLRIVECAHFHVLERPYVVDVDIECLFVKFDEPGVLQNLVKKSALLISIFFYLNNNRLWNYVGDYCITQMLFESNILADEGINKLK